MKRLRMPMIVGGGLHASTRPSHHGRLVISLALICGASVPRVTWAQSSWPSYPNNTAISVTSAGNVGIGTTSPTTPLQVNGNIYGTSTTYTGYGFRIGAPGSYSNQFTYDGTNTYLDYQGPLYLRANTGATNVLTATASGAVGIGTASPTASLENAGSRTAFGADPTGYHWFKTNSGSEPGNVAIGFNATNGVVQQVSFVTEGTWRMFIGPSGNVGIGTSNPQHLLHVAGTIGAEEVIVSSTGADYVFDPGYHLTPLDEVDRYIKQNRHLPDMPSAEEMQQKGASIGEMQAKLLAKIEELTLHLVDEHQRNDRLEQQNRDLQEDNRMIREKIAALEGRIFQ